MNDYENVSELVKKAGCSFEEARYAYEACGKDMLEAVIMLEKARKVRSDGKGYDYSKLYSGSGKDFSEQQKKARENTRKAADAAGGFLKKLCRNTVKVRGEKEYFSLPIIAAIAILLCCWSVAVPAMIISLICGITFTFTGPDFKRDYDFGFNKPKEHFSDESPDPDVQPAQYNYNGKEYNQDKGFFN